MYGTLGVAFEVWVVNAVSFASEFLLHSGIEFSVRVGGGVDEDFHLVTTMLTPHADLGFSWVNDG